MRDFHGIATEIVERKPDLRPCLPAIEKEILHLEILRAMHDEGFLRELTFKGGTCLRLCYGAERLSEDLDFSGGVNFEKVLFLNIEEVLRARIGKRYGLEVQVRWPKTANNEESGHINRWTARIITRPPSRDSRMGVQRIKIEVDNRDFEADDAPRRINCRHDVLADDFTGFPVPSASVQDICSSKMVAYPMSVLTRNNPRHRDVWDIAWYTEPSGAMVETTVRAASKAVADGIRDQLHEALLKTTSLSDELVASDGFMKTVRRFLPASRAQQIKNDDSYRQVLAGAIREFCEGVSAVLPSP